ncbi:hypothetical protein YH64_008190 [Achromobacter sp. LC458]|uniref:hypothetical protein n=1 Tax=Achromobacter sp. LC458 TaxID=1120623 RepID=UPI00062A13B0|nr:hypothetical protein [Achromobacter sp. LC458]TRM53460.1 hypothetical protein YH64_008190 [Achromobacter sp. LC458]
MRPLTLFAAIPAALLAVTLTGCTAPSSYSSTQQGAPAMQRDHANYHSENFGEPDNTPFQGTYPGR